MEKIISFTSSGGRLLGLFEYKVSVEFLKEEEKKMKTIKEYLRGRYLEEDE